MIPSRTRFAMFTLLLIATSCTGSKRATDDSLSRAQSATVDVSSAGAPADDDLIGHYGMRAGKYVANSLWIEECHRFRLSASSCVGRTELCSGTWRQTGGTIELSAVDGLTFTLDGDSRYQVIRFVQGKVVLVPSEFLSAFETDGPASGNCFHASVNLKDGDWPDTFDAMGRYLEHLDEMLEQFEADGSELNVDDNEDAP